MLVKHFLKFVSLASTYLAKKRYKSNGYVHDHPY